MMKKALFSSLIAASLLGASEYNYELSPVAGYVYTEGNTGVENHPLYGAQFQFNNLGTLLKPEISVLFGNADFENNMGDTDIVRTAVNGVYEYATNGKLTPFAKVGLGYQYLSDHTYDNHNSLFADAGAGVKIALAKQLALKLEALYLLDFNDYRWDSNLALLAGLNFAFGEKAQPRPPVSEPKPEPKPKPVPAPLDSDRDGVTDDKDKCPNSPAGYPVDARGCNIDSDGDGVLDPADKCPGTPAGFSVNSDGCPLKATLRLNFASDSAAVDAEGVEKVKDFSTFLKNSPAYKAAVVGHTDSTASEEHNQKLSEKRAETVKSMLIENGVDASRLSSRGSGETQPVASNATPEGRAANRRIEVELSH